MKLALVSYIQYTEPLGILALAAYLEKYAADWDLEIAFFDASDPAAGARIAVFAPDMVGYSVHTGEHTKALQLNRDLKARLGFVSVFGGPHATFFPDLIKQEGVDVIVRGEGEAALLDLLGAWSEGGLKDFNIPNCWIKTPGGEIVQNPLGQSLLDLSESPFSDRRLVYDSNYFLREGGMKSFMTSRGCPYSCTYCYNYKINEMYSGKFVRLMSPERMVSEISLIKSLYRLSFVWFLDDIFAFKKEWLRNFSVLYRENIGVPFNCNLRANLVSGEIVDLLKEAGCVSVSLAIEHGDHEYRKNRLNRDLSDETIIRAVQTIKARGLIVGCQNMIGLPGSDLNQDIKTVELNARAGVDNPIVHVFQPYPGTKLGDQCIQEASFDGNFDLVPDSTYDESILAGSGQRIRKMHDYFPFLVRCSFLRRKEIVRLLFRLPKLPLSRLAYFVFKYFAYRRTFPIKEPMRLRLKRVAIILTKGVFGKLFQRGGRAWSAGPWSRA